MIKDSYGNTRFFGIYRGVVFNNADPLGRNRLRLKVPQILGDLPTEWAWPSVSAGAPFILPSNGDGVWVQFEGGDASFPIWTGTFEAATVVESTVGLTNTDISSKMPATWDANKKVIGVSQDDFEHISNLNYAQLNTAYTGGSQAVGQIAWNITDETPEVKVGNGEVTLQIGQEFHARVSNTSEDAIPNGTVVYYNGDVGLNGHPSVRPYLADGTTSAFKVVGITTQDIPVDGEGLVTVKGKVRGLDTSAFDVGAVLYASPLFEGRLTNAQPTPPDEVVVVAVVTASSATDGEVTVNVVPVINQLTTNITLYQTNVASDISTYYKMVNSQLDPDYNDTAVTIPVPDTALTGIVGSTALLSSFAAPANLFTGDPGAAVNIATAGNIMKTAGNNNTQTFFYFTVYKRDSGGTETLLGTSSQTGPPANVVQNQWQEFSADVSVTLGAFTNTDRIVIKFNAYIAQAGTQAYAFQFGGLSPVRTRVPVPVSVVSTSPASGVSVTTTNFNNILSSADDTVQKALDTIDNSIPTGVVQMWAGSTTRPTGWLLCDGAAVSRTTYANLFATLGTSYGAGDGATTFNLPNLVSKFPRGASTSGATGGSDTHAHTLSNSGYAKVRRANNRIVLDETSSSPDWTADFEVTGTGSTSTQTSSSGAGLGGKTDAVAADSGTFLPPYIALQFIIKT